MTTQMIQTLTIILISFLIETNTSTHVTQTPLSIHNSMSENELNQTLHLGDLDRNTNEDGTLNTDAFLNSQTPQAEDPQAEDPTLDQQDTTHRRGSIGHTVRRTVQRTFHHQEQLQQHSTSPTSQRKRLHRSSIRQIQTITT